MNGIDLVKLSGIVFDALLTGAITFIVLFLSFRWGYRQAKEEQQEKEKNELNLRRIDALMSLIDPLRDFENSTDFNDFVFRFDSYSSRFGQVIIREVAKIRLLFPKEKEPDSNKWLNNLTNEIFFLLPYIQKFATLDIRAKKTEGDIEKPNQVYKEVRESFSRFINCRDFIHNRIEELVNEFG